MLMSGWKTLVIAFVVVVLNWLILADLFGVVAPVFRAEAFATPYMAVPGITNELRREGGATEFP